MAKIYHYVYKIKFPTGHVYFGVRSCKCLPEKDSYLGSPSTHKNYWSEFEPRKTILKEFNSREEASEAEKFLINWQWNSTDMGKEFSLNANIGGMIHNQLGTKRPEEVNKKTSKVFNLVSPEGKLVTSYNIRQFCRDNNLHRKTLGEVINQKILHCNGYTLSKEAHELYLDEVEMAGISKDHTSWRVRTVNSKKATNFKTLREAKQFRDKIKEEGYNFKPCCKGWKEKLGI